MKTAIQKSPLVPTQHTNLRCISKNTDNSQEIHSFFYQILRGSLSLLCQFILKKEDIWTKNIRNLLMTRGTHIYVHYDCYTHHGIDCGDGTVIHYTKSQSTISRTSLAVFRSGKAIFVRKYGRRDSPDVVIQRASSRLGENAYDLFDNNCEHFATWCKTGLHVSEQVERAGAYAGGAAGSVGTATAIAAAGAATVPAGVAALSGAGIMSGLATVGGVVGGGALAGIGLIGAAPAVAAKLAMNQVLRDDEHLADDERKAREFGRDATTLGAVAGTAGAVGLVATTGVTGVSAAGITSGLAMIGGTVGGGMVAGVAITAAAPAVAAAAVGYGAYHLWKWLSE